MPNPKRRHSKRRTSTRRANDFLSKPALAKCPNCHEMKQPHHFSPHCGHYTGKAAQQPASHGFRAFLAQPPHKNPMITIAVDATGGDHSPRPEVACTVLA